MIKAFVVKLAIAFPLIVCFGGGCSTQLPQPPSGKPSVEAEFNIPPRQMVERVKQVLAAPPTSLAVESESNGVLTTGWQHFPVIGTSPAAGRNKLAIT